MNSGGPPALPRRSAGWRLLPAFLSGLVVFGAINLLAANFMSDCGLPALLGFDFCSDDIVRAGWPLVFYEEGGFAFHRYFRTSVLWTDLAIGLVGALIFALVISALRNRRLH